MVKIDFPGRCSRSARSAALASALPRVRGFRRWGFSPDPPLTAKGCWQAASAGSSRGLASGGEERRRGTDRAFCQAAHEPCGNTPPCPTGRRPRGGAGAGRSSGASDVGAASTLHAGESGAEPGMGKGRAGRDPAVGAQRDQDGHGWAPRPRSNSPPRFTFLVVRPAPDWYAEGGTQEGDQPLTKNLK